MKLEEFKSITTEILSNLSDQGKVSALLESLVSDYTEVSTTQETISAKLTEYEGKIKNLQDTNMNLYLKVAQPVPDEQINTTAPMTYENLLKDFGVNE